jgi:hypothetical protein
MQVPAVDLRPLAGVLARVPAARVHILNASFDPKDETSLVLARGRKVQFDFANVESVGGLVKQLQRVGRECLDFGSQFPMFYPESALLKIRESALPNEDVQAVQHANARTLLLRS